MSQEYQRLSEERPRPEEGSSRSPGGVNSSIDDGDHHGNINSLSPKALRWAEGNPGGADIEEHSGGSQKSQTRHDPSDEPGQRPTWSYMKRHMVSHGVVVATLLLINAAQLKTLVLTEDSVRDDLWSASVVLVAISLTLLTTVTVLVTLTSLHRVFSPRHALVNARLTDVTVLCSVLVFICNVFNTIIGLAVL